MLLRCGCWKGWCAALSLGLLGSQIVAGKEEQGPDTRDPWGKVQAKRFGVLLFSKTAEI